MHPPLPQRLLAGALALALAAAVTAASPAARAGACGADCHTVCATGCDFASPRACANDVAAGATCLVLGGHFHETVGLDPDRFTEDLRFVCADPAAAPCRVDGDGVRDHGFLAYRGWEIDGFEVYDTKSHAISNQPSRRPFAVRRCYIHDAGGRGINDVDIGGVIEDNRVVRVFGQGILCTERDALVQNNLVVDAGLDGGSGIQCATSGSVVVHNTVDVRRARAATGAISATTARYNVVAGGATGLSATTDSGENLAWAWTGVAWGGVAGGNGDVTGDPRFFHREDHRPEVGSPAIGLATTSLAAEDLDGDPRDGAPDAGAYEWAHGDVAGPRRWPITEVVAEPGDPAAPVLVVVPGQGPSVLFVDQNAGALIHAVRQSDGAWLHEVIASGVVIPDALSLEPFRHPIAVAVDPVSGQLVVAWTQRTAAAQLEVRVARRDGDVCSAGDCVSPRWSGCTADPALTGDGHASLALAVDPFDGAPVLAVAHQQIGVCGGATPVPHIVVLRRAPDGSWSGPTIESGDCTVRLGLGVAVGVDPITGATDVLYTRAYGAAAGDLVHASDAGGIWEHAPVPLGAGFSTAEFHFTRVAAAHREDDGLLGVAYTQSSPFGARGFGYIERFGDVWGASEVVDVVGPGGIRPMEGLALAFDTVGAAHLAYARNATARVAVRRSEGWDFEIVDPERDTGHWTTLALGPAGEVWVAYQDVDAGGRVRFLGQSDPGGVPPGTALTACDDGDVCTDSHCDAGLGCLHPPLDCDDADACTVDRCQPGAGCVNDPLPCSDGDACTVDGCDPASGCVFPPVSCDDGDACTNDRCEPDGSCEHLALTCDDANDCTADLCDAASGCEHTPVDGPCDDGDPDTINDACAAGACAGVPAVVVLPAVIEGVVMVDDAQLLPPLVLPLVSEGVAIADLPALTPPVVLPLVSEGVAIADLAALTPPVVLPLVVEGLAIADLSTLRPPVVLPVLVEGVALVDAVTATGPPPPIALPLVVEAVTMRDGVPRILPPLVLGLVVEGIAIADASDVLGPPPPLALPLIIEGVALADVAELRPPLVLSVIVEAVGLSDVATLYPPIALPLISETMRVHDVATVTPTAPEPPPRQEPGCAAAREGGPTAILAALVILMAGLVRRQRRSVRRARERTARTGWGQASCAPPQRVADGTPPLEASAGVGHTAPCSMRRMVVQNALVALLALGLAGCFELPPDPTRAGFQFADTSSPDDADEDGDGTLAADSVTAADTVPLDPCDPACPWACVAPGVACEVPAPLVAGGHMTCAGASDGPRCWGDDRYALRAAGAAAPAPFQLTEIAPSAAPGDPAPTLALGDRHACLADGVDRVRCWGANDAHQAGQADLPVIGAPTLVALRDVQVRAGGVPLAAHGDWTCAIREGEVWCWGRSATGVFDHPEPTRLLGFAGINRVEVGGDHVCGVREEVGQPVGSGRLWCWGSNDAGQAGYDPGELPIVHPAREVFGAFAEDLRPSLGARHSCFVGDGGSRAFCFGANDRGQTGKGEGDPGGYAVQDVAALFPGEALRAVVTGDDFTCALLASDQVACFGANDHGQLLASTANEVFQPVMLPLPALDAIAAGPTHVCGVTLDRARVLCWGDDRYGQLGDGRYGSPAVTDPVTVTPPPPDGPCPDTQPTLFHQCQTCYPSGRFEPCPLGCNSAGSCHMLRGLAVGGDHACAFGNIATCWGDNTWGQLGREPAGPGQPPLAPGPVPDVGVPEAMAAGRDHTCVISMTDAAPWRSVRCWGRNDAHQITSGDEPFVVAPTVVPVAGPLQIDAGGDVTCALTQEDGVWCWGGPGGGDLGGVAPARVEALVGRSVTRVAVGDSHACAVLDGGADFACWGPGPGAACAGALRNEPRIEGYWLPLIGLDVGRGRTCVTDLDGRVGCCGDNEGGAAGGPPDEPFRAFGPVVTGHFSGVVVGGEATCAHTFDRQVACWGSNASGLLGGHDLPAGPTAWPIGSLPGSERLMLAIGPDSACALHDLTFVRCWGDDSRGVRGGGAPGDRVAPWADVIREPPAPR